eukprot:CAMPEP_0185283884 /NCGR_PEP_ID=MMETSP1363-20130426/741_1 /TAXON_ID=38817 /ORGANISM="Gephyrocapsa oceanica, Strain RCC1303" /LENGTH=165 /DNA_ID=CAMNT_0027879563 /DNA_START=146 /DNA_END=644 /DNA_ORIENTATION=-
MTDRTLRVRYAAEPALRALSRREVAPQLASLGGCGQAAGAQQRVPQARVDVAPRPLRRGHRRAQRRDRVGKQVEHKEGGDWRDVEPSDRRNDAAEEVEVHVRDGEDGTEERDALRLRHPREQDAERDDAAVQAQEVEAAVNEKLACGAVTDDERERRASAHGLAR